MKDTPTRDAYGETLVELGADLRIVVLDAGVSDSTRSKKIGDKYGPSQRSGHRVVTEGVQFPWWWSG